jgi:predicted nuclease of predicted toxin-antitoxin system
MAGPWRFFLDHDVPASVGRMLRGEGHECWTASEAGLATEGQDDNLTVYAHTKEAVLVTMDKEFSLRRRTNSIGRHIWLRCPEPEAATVLRSWLGKVLPYLERDNVTVTVPNAGIHPERGRE